MYKKIGILTLLTAAEYLFGFLRSVLIAAFFGVSAHTEAFFLSYGFIMTMAVILAGMSRTVVIPVISHIRARAGEQASRDCASNLLSIVMIGLGILSVCIFAAAPVIVSALIGNYAHEVRLVATHMLRGLSVLVFLIGTGNFLAGYLNVERSFFIPAGSVLAGSFVSLLVVVFFHSAGVAVLVWVFVAATLVPFLAQLIFSRRSFQVRPVRPELDAQARKALTLAAPLLLMMLVTQVARSYESWFAARTMPGAITVLNYGRLLSEMPLRLFAAIFMTVLFPLLSMDAAQMRTERLTRYTGTVSRIILLFGVPVTLVCLVFPGAITRIIFERGAFTSRDAALTSGVFFLFCPGIIAALFGSALSHVYFALMRMKTLALITASAMLLNVLLDFMLVRLMSYNGLALGYTLSLFMYAGTLLYVLKKQVGIRAGSKVVSLIPALGAAAVCMVIVLVLARAILSREGVFLEQVSSFMLCVSAGIAVYILVLRAFGVEELSRLRAFFIGRNLQGAR
jgi:putative peptidoglycan lipid II flippase